MNERSSLTQQIRRGMIDATERELDGALRNIIERQMREGVEGVERRYRVAVLQPLQLDDVRRDTETSGTETGRFSSYPEFQVVFNGRDIVRVVD